MRHYFLITTYFPYKPPMYSKASTPIRLLLAFVLYPLLLAAQQNITIEEDSLMLRGKTNYSSDFFRDRLLHNSMESFLDNYNDFSRFIQQFIQY
jgi:hypothetical protein